MRNPVEAKGRSPKLWPRQRKREWESIDSTSEENTDDWGIVYDIKDPEVMPGDCRASDGTQAKTLGDGEPQPRPVVRGAQNKGGL